MNSSTLPSVCSIQLASTMDEELQEQTISTSQQQHTDGDDGGEVPENLLESSTSAFHHDGKCVSVFTYLLFSRLCFKQSRVSMYSSQNYR